MHPAKKYTAHAVNLKYALRHAVNRFREGDLKGDRVTVLDIGLVSIKPLQAGLVEGESEAVKLAVSIDTPVVLLVDYGQFGIPYEHGYMPVTATKLVAELTKDVEDEEVAFDTLIRYLWALHNLAR